MKKAKIRKMNVLSRTIILIFAFLLLPDNSIKMHEGDSYDRDYNYI